MAIPDYQSLMIHILKESADGEIKISKCVENVANKLNLSDQDRNRLLPTGRQTILYNRCQWAKSYLTCPQQVVQFLS